jgi:outer membrane receptor for monomeric catechols
MRRWLVCVFLIVLVATPLSTSAQTAPPSSVSGQVLDPSGSPIAGAVVVVSNGRVVNRVGKEAVFQPLYEVSLQGGAYGNKRITTDLDQQVGEAVAFRVNGMFEDSDSFRDRVGLRRHGITPTVTFTPSSRTKIVASYEYLNDTRVADRGITSLQGRPVTVDPSTYFGNPADSHVTADVNLGFVTIEHQRADPNDPTRIIQTGSQRTNGYELGVNGRVTAAWAVAGGYAYQNAFVTSATVSAAAGAQVGQVPHHTLSLWNNYRLHPKVSAGLGLLYRSDMFVAVDNAVTLPGYTRADAALFYALTDKLRLQLNVENLLDGRDFINADSNTNISPGSPRAGRIALITRF